MENRLRKLTQEQITMEDDILAENDFLQTCEKHPHPLLQILMWTRCLGPMYARREMMII